MNETTKTVELLAPAGTPECLRAAVRAGADAVYLGLEEFNARRNADNFTLETLAETCDYAHLRGVAVYVTMNVEILPGELDRAVASMIEAWKAGADAFIVQDIGLAAEVHQRNPEIPLHASTQMNIHNAAGMEFAAVLGMERVTLARELSLAEIEELCAIANVLGMEVECFVHGAICVCYSGQCLMSSMIGGRSANRGLCAQPCRLPYELRQDDNGRALAAPGEHLLSPRDLCGASLVKQLIDAGAASLKVEGRMKSADYVFEVVSTYREIIDSQGVATDRHRARLSEAFSRGFTAGYMEGERGNDLMSYGRPNNRGVFAGRVTAVERGRASVKAELALNAGDVIEFWTNRGHFAATVEDACAVGSNFSVAVDKPVGKGDRVFRVRNSQTVFADQPFLPRITVTGEVFLHRGQPAHLVFRTADGTQAESWGDVVEAARTKPLSRQDVIDHVNRLGQTPFQLEEDGEGLTVLMDDGVGMGFSSLHHLRAQALQNLEQELLERWRQGRRAEEQKQHRIDAWEATGAPDGKVRESKALVGAWVGNPGAARAARKAGADVVYVPLLNFKRGQAQQKGVRCDHAEQAGYPKQCIMALPVVDHDPVAGTREAASNFDFWDYVRQGKPVFADNIGDAWRALQLGAQVEIGPHVPVTNVAALRFLARLGVRRVWLSPELSLGQVASLAQNSPLDLGMFISGAQELMVTEHCILMSQGACAQQCETCERRSIGHHLTDRKGFDFPVVTDMLGRSHIYNGVEFDGVSSLCDFMAMGISAFMVDASLLGKEVTGNAVRRAVRARDLCLSEGRSLEKRPGTTTGHLFRGVM